LGLLWAVGAPDANAEEVAALRARIAREAVRRRYLGDAQTSVAEAIVATEVAIADRRREAEELERAREAAEADRVETAQRLAAVRTDLEALRRAAGRRAAAMRRIARLGPEAFWLGIEDPLRARRTRDRLRFVLEHDAELGRRIRRALRAEQREVERLESVVVGLEIARERLRAEASELAGLRAEREVLLEALRKERRRSDRIAAVLARARREADRAARLVRGRAAPPPPRAGDFSAQQGVLPWPTPGRVEVTFGAKVHPAGVIVRQSGLDVRAPQGQPVRSPFPGTVAFAARRRGWGRLVIVEHPGGFFTVYARLAAFAVDAGQAVRRGQRIGDVGASDSEKGPHLYFEIRRGDRPVDPLRWLHGA